jgi:hypothetical protein
MCTDIAGSIFNVVDGRVLLTGGVSAGALTAALEVYDPTDNSIATLPVALSTARQDHRAVSLDNGRVLIMGGSNQSGVLNSTEIHLAGSEEITIGTLLFREAEPPSDHHRYGNQRQLCARADHAGPIDRWRKDLPPEQSRPRRRHRYL